MDRVGKPSATEDVAGITFSVTRWRGYGFNSISAWIRHSGLRLCYVAGGMSKTPEEDHDDVMNMTSQEVHDELKRRGIDTKDAVSHVLQMVREAKKKRDKYRASLN